MKKAFSIIELMLALSVFIILAVMTFQILNSTQKASTISQFYINTQANSRKAYLHIITQLENATTFMPTDAFMPTPVIFPGYSSGPSEEDISTNKPSSESTYIQQLLSTPLGGYNIVYTGDNTNNGEVLDLIDRTIQGSISSSSQNDSEFFNLENYNIIEYKINQDPNEPNNVALAYIKYPLKTGGQYPANQVNIESVNINTQQIFRYIYNGPYIMVTRNASIPLTTGINNQFQVLLSLPKHGTNPSDVITFTVIRQPLLKQNFQLTGAIPGADRSCSAYRLILDINAYYNSGSNKHKRFKYDSVVNILSTSSIPTF